jgi:proline racemase
MAAVKPELEIRTLDYHTAGEPLRIVTAGLPSIPGDSMAAKRRYVATRFDHIRKLLINEPRGHADMYGAIITAPVTPGADCGVLFMHNEGYSTMCGHGIIALATAVMEHGLSQVANPDAMRIDTPAGPVVARARFQGGTVRSVRFENVPAFVLAQGRVKVEGTPVPYALAFGGAFYAYVNAADVGLSLEPEFATRIIGLGREIRQSISEARPIRHPGGAGDLDFLYGVIFVEPGADTCHSRNACVFAAGQLDRSPTGTGVSGRAAIHFARGEIGLGEALEIESIIGTRFRVRCIAETRVGDVPAVLTEVTGSAHQTGSHTFVLGSDDPLPEGVFIR